MNAAPPSFVRTPDPDDMPPERMAVAHWAALRDAAGLVAALSGLPPEQAAGEGGDFLAMLRDAEAWRRTRAGQSLADLAAILEPGIAALVAINARGADPQPAARALWREFDSARTALFALLSPAE